MISDQSIILDYIHDASRLITNWTQRTFVPYISATEQVEYNVSPYRVQPLPDDTLSVTSIKDSSDTTLTANTDYRLKDIYNNLNGYPYGYFELSSLSGFSTSHTSGFDPVWTVNGIFGYSSRPYSDAWQATTTINADIDDASATTITVTNNVNIEILSYIRINDEFMQVVDKSGANTLTVKRGVNGSTAVATHTNGDTTDIWLVDETIQLAATRLAAWLYSSRQNEFQSLQFQDGTVASIRYPQIVQHAIRHYVKPIAMSMH